VKVKSYPSAVAVERAVELLYLLGERGDASLPVLAREIGSSRSAVRRILTALRRKGLVELDPVTDQYSLSWLVLTLAKSRQDRVGLREVAMTPMTELRNRTRETVTLNVRSGFQRVCIEQVEGQEEVRWQGQVGRIDILYAGAGGKALLAYFPMQDLERYLSQVKRRQLTPSTILDQGELECELEEIRRRGYATGRQDRQVGVSGVSAPIFNEAGAALASITVAAPAERGTLEQLEAWAPEVMRAASRISDLLGHLPEEGAV
jgi:DNA-binding IclR family transcriptional regulator